MRQRGSGEKTGKRVTGKSEERKRVKERREKRRKKVEKYVITVVACIVCWGKVVVIVGELCPCVARKCVL